MVRTLIMSSAVGQVQGLLAALKAGIEDQIAIDQPTYVSVKVR